MFQRLLPPLKLHYKFHQTVYYFRNHSMQYSRPMYKFLFTVDTRNHLKMTATLATITMVYLEDKSALRANTHILTAMIRYINRLM